jgi:MerR family transcriptional regulator/heat shock protein HspR
MAQRESERLQALDDDDAALFSVGQVAALLDVPVRQLRRLDQQGIVTPDRSQGNQRRYSRREIDRLHDALALISDDLTLPAVRRIMELQDRVADLEKRLTQTQAQLQNRNNRSPRWA